MGQEGSVNHKTRSRLLPPRVIILRLELRRERAQIGKQLRVGDDPRHLVLGAEPAAPPHPFGEAARWQARTPAARACRIRRRGAPRNRGCAGSGPGRSPRRNRRSRLRRRPGARIRRHTDARPSRPAFAGKTAPTAKSRSSAPIAAAASVTASLDFLAGQMLAERRQRVGQPPGYQETRRVAADKANRVAKDKAPQPGAGAQHRGVFDPGLDFADRMPRRRRRIDLADRHELIENAVIENDAHAPRRVRDRRRR